jgi:hypothetical protein
MMRGASGDECGKLLGQEYNRPAEAGVLKKPREATFLDSFRNYLERKHKKIMLTLYSLTLNLLTTTIVAPPSNATNGRWDLIRRLKGLGLSFPKCTIQKGLRPKFITYT